MKSKKIHLFIGRFQPMHNAHLEVIKKIYSNMSGDDILVIAIGSSQESGTFENPLTARERERMIRLCFAEERIKKYSIIYLPDFEKDKNWIEHLEKELRCLNKNKQAKTKIFAHSGNPRVIKIFSELNSARKNKFAVKKIKLIEGINATKIRKLILKNEEWEHLVPESVYKFLKRINIEKIVKNSNRKL